MRSTATISFAKSLLKISRTLGRGGGSALPGLVAEKMDPQIGSRLARGLHHGSIVVTGTNGKTTTSKMLAQILTDAGENLVSNRAGSNLSRGVVSALIEHASLKGEYDEAAGLFEVDEAAMPGVCQMLQPKIIVVLNLFRDQLDRYGELDTTASLVGRGIEASPEAKVFLNADDPLVASLSKYAKPGNVQFFGLNSAPTSKLAHDVTADSTNCPVCGRALTYSKNFFGHLGHYACPEGHFDRPKPQLQASKIKLEAEGGEATFGAAGNSFNVKLGLPGLYNIYNALAASITANELAINASSISHSIENVEAAFGRVEKLTIKGRTIYILLVKNPTGFNQIIQTFLLSKKQQNLLLCINDNFADGRDVSWLWDVAFEEMQPLQHRICVSGLRATDMALRLKYANMGTDDIQPELKKSLNHFITQVPNGGVGYIIPTYTAMLQLRRLLKKSTKMKGEWQ